MNDETRLPRSNLERFRASAKTRRELAWELLKQTRNAPYVALRYGYDIETMEAALEKIPIATEPGKELSHPAKRVHSSIKRASEVLPDFGRGREPGGDEYHSKPTRCREPGEDDDIGEDDNEIS